MALLDSQAFVSRQTACLALGGMSASVVWRNIFDNQRYEEMEYCLVGVLWFLPITSLQSGLTGLALQPGLRRDLARFL
jgi:hypothetical protein